MPKFNNKPGSKKSGKGYYYDCDRLYVRHHLGKHKKTRGSCRIAKRVSTKAEAKRMVANCWWEKDHQYKNLLAELNQQNADDGFNITKKETVGYYLDQKRWRLRHYVGHNSRKNQSVFLSKFVSTKAEAKKMVEDKWYKDEHTKIFVLLQSSICSISSWFFCGRIRQRRQ